MKLNLQRPLAVFDIEATGLNPRADRIVELSIVKVMPDGTREVHTFRVNPQIPIAPDAIRVHGITDADVAKLPTFADIAPHVYDLLEGCDLGGYNAVNYDVPLLVEEFMRARKIFSLDGRRIVDAQRIFHRKEPRDLAAAVAYFCGEQLERAHGAEVDALATVRVLDAQLERYTDLPQTVEGLDEFCNPKDPDWADRAGRLKWSGRDLTINFGQKKGVPLRVLVKDDPKYLRWILRGDFPRDMQDIVRAALEDGRFPAPPDRPAEGSPGEASPTPA